MNITHLKLGTRGSKLAIIQAEEVRQAIHKYHPEIAVEFVFITTRGDKERTTPLPQIGGKGLFTAELEYALESGQIDIAAHSLKDMPAQIPDKFTLAAILPRASVHDVLVSPLGGGLNSLPPGAKVGTSSPRRENQLALIRPDCVFENIRGNVETRIAKVKEGQFAATVLAQAGLDRLGILATDIGSVLPLTTCLPAPGQGAIAVECSLSREEIRELLSAINCPKTSITITCERHFLDVLKAGCSTPLASYAYFEGEELVFWARFAQKGSPMIERKLREQFAPGVEIKLAEQMATFFK